MRVFPFCNPAASARYIQFVIFQFRKIISSESGQKQIYAELIYPPIIRQEDATPVYLYGRDTFTIDLIPRQVESFKEVKPSKDSYRLEYYILRNMWYWKLT